MRKQVPSGGMRFRASRLNGSPYRINLALQFVKKSMKLPGDGDVAHSFLSFLLRGSDGRRIKPGIAQQPARQFP